MFNYIKDETNTTFNLKTKADDATIETNYAVITLNEVPEPVLITNFTVSTQMPGSNIKLKVGVAFINN